MNRPILVMTILASLSASSFAQNAQSLLDQGQNALNHHDKDEALKFANEAVRTDPAYPFAYLFRATVFDQRKEYATAAADYTKLIGIAPSLPGVYQLRGMDYFRLGQFEDSLKDLDKSVAMRPDLRADNWPRGITLYYLGKFDLAARQFALHATVNPDDVENVAWHFISVARASGVDAARKAMLPPGDDDRVPMKQIYALYAGKGDEKAVFAAAAVADSAKPKQLRQQQLFAHLYVGLYHEALGDAAAAKEQILLADQAGGEGYMSDVAHVHAGLLKQGK